MIHDHDRSGWVGASDSARLLAPWDGKTFSAFMLEKLGLYRRHVTTRRMQTGTFLEGKILDAIGISRRDRQIRRRRLRLRVNLDGESRDTVYEVKTYEGEAVDLRPYWAQAQAEMYATGKRLVIVAYRIEEADNDNYYRGIDPERISYHPIEYDERWIREEYLPRLRVVARCIKKRRWPSEGEIARFSKKRRRTSDPVPAAS